MGEEHESLTERTLAATPWPAGGTVAFHAVSRVVPWR